MVCSAAHTHFRFLWFSSSSAGLMGLSLELGRSLFPPTAVVVLKLIVVDFFPELIQILSSTMQSSSPAICQVVKRLLYGGGVRLQCCGSDWCWTEVTLDLENNQQIVWG